MPTQRMPKFCRWSHVTILLAQLSYLIRNKIYPRWRFNCSLWHSRPAHLSIVFSLVYTHTHTHTQASIKCCGTQCRIKITSSYSTTTALRPSSHCLRWNVAMPSNRSVPPSQLKEPFRCHTITQGKANIMEPENREVTWRIALDRAGTLGRAGPARPDPLVPRVISGLDF